MKQKFQPIPNETNEIIKQKIPKLPIVNKINPDITVNIIPKKDILMLP